MMASVSHSSVGTWALQRRDDDDDDGLGGGVPWEGACHGKGRAIGPVDLKAAV